MSSAPIVDRIRIIPRPDDFLDRNFGNSGEVFFDKDSASLRLFDGDEQGGYTVLTNSNLQNNIIDSGVALVEYTVTVGTDPDEVESGNKYFIDGEYKPKLNFVIGYTYIFNQNDQTNEYFPNPEGGTVNQHPLNFSSDDTNGELGTGTTYLQNVVYKLDGDAVDKQTYWDKFAAATQRSVQITVLSSTPTTLYYWCQQHTGMGNEIVIAQPGTGSGGSISVSATPPEDVENGAIWFNSDTGKIYVYLQDEDSIQWVQPTYPVPTALTDLGITDGTVGQVLTTDGDGNFTFEDSGGGGSVGNFTLDASVITTDDSSGISIVPATTFNSDVTVENDLIVNGKTSISGSLNVQNITDVGLGAASIDSATTHTLSAPDGVIIRNSPLRLPPFTTAERDLLTPEEGDVILNTTLNTIQAYISSSWTNL